MNKLADFTLILDCSSSMTSIWSSTINGINSLIAKQLKAQGKLVFSVLTFSSVIQWVRIATPIQNVARVGEHEFQLRQGTRLLDAFGEAITSTEERISKAHSSNPPRVLIAVMTDGLENASRNYSGGQVAKMILEKRRSGWEFLFFGAKQDASKSAVRLGIPSSSAMNFVCTDESATKVTDLLNREIIKFSSGEATGFFPAVEDPGADPAGDTGCGT